MAGNGHHYKTPAEVSTNLRRRPFFWSTLDFGRKFVKFRTKIFFFIFCFVYFLVSTRIAAALQLRLDSTVQASTHATSYSLNAACIQHPVAYAGF